MYIYIMLQFRNYQKRLPFQVNGKKNELINKIYYDLIIIKLYIETAISNKCLFVNISC